jgi:peptidoglycan/xylan/chitin deacetylase (PgdA/CDA1 family)
VKPSPYGPFKYIPLPERPRLVWPDGARVALWIAPNIEWFALDSNLPGRNNERIAPDKVYQPEVRSWSVRDYGNRIGVWRVFEVMAKHGVRGTAPLNSQICDVHPQIVETAMRAGWEMMGHNQTNSVRCVDVPRDQERAEIKATLDRIGRMTGKRPVGWLGAGTAETWDTLDHLVAEDCRYVGDWTNDEQPYVMTVNGKQIVSIPYTSEINDVTCYFTHKLPPDEYEKALRRHFDVLYRDGATTGRVLGIPIHPFITGTPQRIDAFDRALDYMLSHAGVWPATASEIVDYYLASGAAI